MANDEDYSGPYASGSIKSYFTAQSAGKFVPTFDIVGPVDLPHEMAYYGYDERAAELMIDACSMADANTDVDFSKYDYNGDGYVDLSSWCMPATDSRRAAAKRPYGHRP